MERDLYQGVISDFMGRADFGVIGLNEAGRTWF